MTTESVHDKVLSLAKKRPGQSTASTAQNGYVALPDDLQYDEPNDFAFLREYVKWSKRWSPRSPDMAHEAVAMHILAAAAAGRVEYEYGGRHRTSLYQFLVAPSSLWAKTTVANYGDKVLSAAGLGRVRIGRATPQSFFDQCLEKVPADFATLSTNDQNKIRERLRNAGQRAWIADEFGAWASAMLREGSVSYEFRGLLLEIYGSMEYVERSTRTYGTLPVNRPTLALFALSTYQDVQKIASAGSPFWHDGLLARFDWITVADDEKVCNDQFPDEDFDVPGALVQTLQSYDDMLGRPQVHISPVTEQGRNKKDKVVRYDVEITRQPEFVVRLSPDVREALRRYEVWLRDTIAQGQVQEDLQASYARMPDRALRMASLLASLERLQICELRHWKKAQAITERRRQCLHWTYERLTDTARATEQVSKTDRILRYVQSERCVTAKQIHDKFRRLFPGMAELKRELDALVGAGELRSVNGKRGRVHYAFDASDLPNDTKGKSE
jgi:hypothetical protein